MTVCNSQYNTSSKCNNKGGIRVKFDIIVDLKCSFSKYPYNGAVCQNPVFHVQEDFQHLDALHRLNKCLVSYLQFRSTVQVKLNHQITLQQR